MFDQRLGDWLSKGLGFHRVQGFIGTTAQQVNIHMRHEQAKECPAEGAMSTCGRMCTIAFHHRRGCKSWWCWGTREYHVPMPLFQNHTFVHDLPHPSWVERKVNLNVRRDLEVEAQLGQRHGLPVVAFVDALRCTVPRARRGHVPGARPWTVNRRTPACWTPSLRSKEGAHTYTLRRWSVIWCYIMRLARDMYEQPASVLRCDMVLHPAFRTRHPKHKM